MEGPASDERRCRHSNGARRFGALNDGLFLARLRPADEYQGCPLIEVDRKEPTDGKSDAIDPKRRSTGRR